MSIMGLVWAPNFLLDTTHMRLQNPSKSLGILRYLEVSKSEKRRPNCADDAGLKKHAPNPVCVRVHRDGLLTLRTRGPGVWGPGGVRGLGLGPRAPIMCGQVADLRLDVSTQQDWFKLGCRDSAALLFSVVAQEINRRNKPVCRDRVRTNAATIVADG